MSATNKPYGLRPVKNLFGGEIRTETMYGGIASAYDTSIRVGDPIRLLTGGTFALAAATEDISGVFAGVLFEDAGVWQQSQMWTADTTYTKDPQVLYYPAANFEFAIQGAGTIARTAIGDSADWVAGTGNDKAGTSGGYLASGSLAGDGNSAQLKIMGLVQKPGNAWGDSYTEVLVRINELNTGLEVGVAI